MKTVNRHTGSVALIVTLAIILLYSGSALATDDGQCGNKGHRSGMSVY